MVLLPALMHNVLVGSFHTQQQSQKPLLLLLFHSELLGSKLNMAPENATLSWPPGLSAFLATGGLLHLPMSHRPLGLAGSLPRVLSVDWHPFALRKECLHVSSDS